MQTTYENTYKSAGVSVDAANMLTNILSKEIKSDNLSNFAGLVEHPYIPEYFLAACTDGVGTKVIPLIKRGLVETIATDLIAMNLNDLICTGASPMFFLDYVSTNKLDVELASKFIISLKNKLVEYNCSLLGGETSELADIVKEGCFDFAGFMVGIVRKDSVLDKNNVQAGDLIIALESSGPHSNGYSLIRKLHESAQLGSDLFEEALEPTYIYAKEIKELTDKKLIHTCANITGGGIEDNLVRSIPKGKCGVIDKTRTVKKPIFEKLQKLVGEEEAYKTFNMGVGFCIIAPNKNADKILEICEKYNPRIIGRIEDEVQCSGIRFRWA